MTLEELLVEAAKAASVPASQARTVAAQLRGQAEATKEVEALLKALDAGLRTRWAQASAGELAAARAVLSGLEALVRDGDDTRQQMPKVAQLDADNEARSLDRYGDGRWRCARCGSQRIDDERTGRDRVRWIQLLCDACGLSVDGMDGDPALKAWQRS